MAFLLAAIADGRSDLDLHAPPGSAMEETWRNILAEQGETLEERLEIELGWVEAARQAVGPHIPLLYEFLDHEDFEVRQVMSAALAHYPQHKEASLVRLNAVLENEAQEEICETIKASVASLSHVD